MRVETPDEKHVQVSVRDHGVGVPAPELKRIFKRFYRVPNRSSGARERHRPGIVYRAGIAKKHGGKVSAESAGEGQARR